MTVHTVESTSDSVRVGFWTHGASRGDDPARDVVSPRYVDSVGQRSHFGETFADREPLRHRYPSVRTPCWGPLRPPARAGGCHRMRHALAAHPRLGLEFVPSWGGCLALRLRRAIPDYFHLDRTAGTTEFVDGITLTLAPFLGVMAVEPAGDAEVSAILAGPYGGNLVLRELTVGSSLFLPVQKPGGRVWTGDVHALQGDGVVDQTAIETAAEDLQIRYELHKGVALQGPSPRRRPTGSLRLCRRPRRCARLVSPGPHLVAPRRLGHLRERGQRPVQHGSELPASRSSPIRRVPPTARHHRRRSTA